MQETVAFAHGPHRRQQRCGLDVARKMLDAAVAEVGKNGWQEAIAIVDSGGRLVAFLRMDNTQLASIESALGEAVTANNVKRPTKALQDSLWRPKARLRAGRDWPA
ncbi:MAG: GlcG/HbpS family heme-binding protein [Reyranella sp.]